jgi:hypothetical protein
LPFGGRPGDNPVVIGIKRSLEVRKACPFCASTDNASLQLTTSYHIEDSFDNCTIYLNKKWSVKGMSIVRMQVNYIS